MSDNEQSFLLSNTKRYHLKKILPRNKFRTGNLFRPMMTKIPVRPLTGAGTPERTDIHKTTSLPKAEADGVRPFSGTDTPGRTDKRKRATRLPAGRRRASPPDGVSQ